MFVSKIEIKEKLIGEENAVLYSLNHCYCLMFFELPYTTTKIVLLFEIIFLVNVDVICFLYTLFTTTHKQ